MKIKKFLHFHLSSDSRRDEIINLVIKQEENNKTKLLDKKITSLFKNRSMLYISWLINNSNQSTQEMADSIYKDIVEHS